MIRNFLVCFFLFSSAASSVHALTIDFNEFDSAGPAGTVDYGGIYASQNGSLEHMGFSWGGASGFGIMTSAGPAAPEDGAGIFLTWDPAATPGSMTLLDESATFSIHSLDAYEDYDALVTAYYAKGGTVSLQLHDIYDGEKFVFGAEWSGLSSIEFSNQGIWGQDSFGASPLIIDEVTISVVPVPAAVWLFGSALAGLGLIRRKQTI